MQVESRVVCARVAEASRLIMCKTNSVVGMESAVMALICGCSWLPYYRSNTFDCAYVVYVDQRLVIIKLHGQKNMTTCTYRK